MYHNIIKEKIAFNKDNLEDYTKNVADAYKAAPIDEPRAHPAYQALNESNYLFFKRLDSKIKVVFCSSSPSAKTININGKDYDIIKVDDDPYPNQSVMKKDVIDNKRLVISMDYSDHPFFSVADNIVFRTVHDYIVHILGNKQFGLDGELKSYNLHAKLVLVIARPAIFTEVVGQVCYHKIENAFPTQKCAILDGFDYVNVGLYDKDILKKS